ncbi:bile acid:sodium symporter family protein [Aquibacillus koreensis]|uniref:Bile acid:sodium symporter family protein n=1 Tax=Aquibacillus koreensis TaxID=279446 RepID=A0A9X3WPV4_9BACI|nr:bile acid:sodium symporter family protein [Aquibacillus koreensis]MCT2536166.1 bile acid:sodium symporter family protein [Aquibacillus koreensis]MDC3422091.1 bile acid:sodium symporter family protein [Aquibacillus koreensis]
MLIRLNKKIEKIMPIIAPLSVIIGVLLASGLAPLSFLVPWIFAFMTFSGSLSSSFKSLQRAIANPFPIVIVLTILHVFMPLLAWAVGYITFQDDMLTITGFILAMVIPTGITSFIWVAMYKGNIALTLSIILIDTILAPFIVPSSLSILVGQSVELDSWNMMKGLIGMIVLPSLAGMFLNHITNGKITDSWSPILAPISKLGLASVIMINSAVVAPFLSQISWKLVGIAAVMFGIAFCGYLLSWTIGTILKREKDIVIALTFTGGMRNISAGAVIAVAFFPPPVAVPVVIGMLFQQVLASIYGQFIGRYYAEPTVQNQYD